MEGTVFSGSEGKSIPGGFSWVNSGKLEMHKTRWLPRTEAGWEIKDTDAKSGALNSSSSQHPEHRL